MPKFVQPTAGQRFSDMYPFTRPGVAGDLVMDMSLPQGSVSYNNILSDAGTGTTDATAGTTVQISHNLGVVPNFVLLTSTANGAVYLDKSNPATATTFNVLGSAASLTFDWMVI